MEEALIRAALHARSHSYAPYSHFLVGAALLTSDHTIIEGSNIENASYGASNCAERTAFFKAVSEGFHTFEMIAIAGGPDTDPKHHVSGLAYPCGICRQVMREFCDPETFKVLIARSVDDYECYTLEELLPTSFGPENLQE
ncbi:MAG: cytidine deaminase [Lachnospiraceae bacterium]|nr:cytidine deaminase [Lachnospiraceae bacterium]